MGTSPTRSWGSFSRLRMSANAAVVLLAVRRVRSFRARRTAIRSSVQPAQRWLTYTGAVVATGAFIGSFVAGDAGGDVFRDLAVQAAVLAALTFIPGLWWERQVVILCVMALVVLDMTQLYAVTDWHRFFGVEKNIAFSTWVIASKSTLGAISTGVLIAQALSPLWMRLLALFVREIRDLAIGISQPGSTRRASIRIRRQPPGARSGPECQWLAHDGSDDADPGPVLPQ